MMEAQKRVAESVAKRGYRDGWTPEQFLARQVCKLVEELGELAANIGRTRAAFWEDWTGEPLDNPFWKRWGWQGLLIVSAKSARAAFDGKRTWEDAAALDIKAVMEEAADLQVVLFNIAAAIEEITGEPFDVVQAAVDKAARRSNGGSG